MKNNRKETSSYCAKMAARMKKKYDKFESEMIKAYEKGELISTNPSKAEIEKFRSVVVYQKWS